MKQRPRGIRNNNPGNIRRSKDPWQGLAEKQTDRSFFRFESAIYGIRALARVLITYQDKHQLRTIKSIIGRWAPKSENDTDAYVRTVANQSGFDVSQKLDMHRFEHLRPIVEAIIWHENGQQPYSEAEVTKALVLAGVEPQKQNLQETRTVKAGQAATAGTVGIGVIQALEETIEPAKSALLSVVPYLEAAKWLLLLVTVIGILTMLWARIDDRRKGLR